MRHSRQTQVCPAAWGLATRLAIAALGVLSLVAGRAISAQANSPQSSMEARLTAIANDPLQRRQFFIELPKGADLHQHLSGTVYAETLIGWAAQDGLCLSLISYALSPPPCHGDQLAASNLPTNVTLQGKVVAAWSMRLFSPNLGASGHDHFFGAFALYDQLWNTPGRQAAALAVALDQAARDHVLRLETKLTPNGKGASQLAAALSAKRPMAVLDPGSFPQALEVLQAAGLEAVAEGARQDTTLLLAQARAHLDCDSPQAHPGCAVEVGLVAQANRNASPTRVFAALATGFASAARDRRWLAVDLVSPEDVLNALADYHLHMQMVKFLHGLYPQVHVDLHGGELIAGLVPPADLNFHIREAVLVAGTERLGHGVSIRSEQNAQALLKIMRDRGVTVEIALSSNEQILGIQAETSQFRVYRAAGIPIVLATDDAGISRTDLSEQYQKAFSWFKLSYHDLKQLSCQSVRSSFLTSQERVRLQEKLEAAFRIFERKWSNRMPSKASG